MYKDLVSLSHLISILKGMILIELWFIINITAQTVLYWKF